MEPSIMFLGIFSHFILYFPIWIWKFREIFRPNFIFLQKPALKFILSRLPQKSPNFLTMLVYPWHYDLLGRVGCHSYADTIDLSSRDRSAYRNASDKSDRPHWSRKSDRASWICSQWDARSRPDAPDYAPAGVPSHPMSIEVASQSSESRASLAS